MPRPFALWPPPVSPIPSLFLSRLLLLRADGHCPWPALPQVAKGAAALPCLVLRACRDAVAHADFCSGPGPGRVRCEPPLALPAAALCGVCSHADPVDCPATSRLALAMCTQTLSFAASAREQIEGHSRDGASSAAPPVGCTAAHCSHWKNHKERHVAQPCGSFESRFHLTLPPHAFTSRHA